MFGDVDLRSQVKRIQNHSLQSTQREVVRERMAMDDRETDYN